MRIKTIDIVLYFILSVVILFCFCGCEGLRGLMISEDVQQLAELNYDISRDIMYKGTKKGSEEGRRIERGSRAILSFTGMSEKRPQMKDFDKIANRAESSLMNPDVLKIMGIGGSGLLGILLAYFGLGWLNGGKLASTLIKGVQLIKNKLPAKYKKIANETIQTQAIQDNINKKLTKKVKKVKGK